MRLNRPQPPGIRRHHADFTFYRYEGRRRHWGTRRAGIRFRGGLGSPGSRGLWRDLVDHSRNHRDGSRLDVSGQSNPPFESLELSIFNASRRRVTLRDAVLKYGLGPNHSQTVLRVDAFSDLALDPGDGRSARVAVAEVRKAVAEQRIPQREYCRLWFVAFAFNGRSYPAVVQVHRDIIPGNYLASAEFFIAADLLMGFSKLASHVSDHWKMK